MNFLAHKNTSHQHTLFHLTSHLPPAHLPEGTREHGVCQGQLPGRAGGEGEALVEVVLRLHLDLHEVCIL